MHRLCPVDVDVGIKAFVLGMFCGSGIELTRGVAAVSGPASESASEPGSRMVCLSLGLFSHGKAVNKVSTKKKDEVRSFDVVLSTVWLGDVCVCKQVGIIFYAGDGVSLCGACRV